MSKWFCVPFFVLLGATTLFAKEWYVDGVNGNDSRDGVSWLNARKTIRSAYNSASDGDIVHVADGVYPRISLSGNKSVVIESVGGWEHATIDANRENRCAYLGDNGETNIVLRGFTLTNGLRDGSGGGAYYGTLENCRLLGNKSVRSGGAAYGSSLYNCLVISNEAQNCAGGVCDGKMVSCKVVSNVATNSGGGSYGGVAVDCVISSNYCGRCGGGAYETILSGCTLSGNSSGSAGGGVYDGKMISCKVVSNVATNWGGAFYGGVAENCVVAGNCCGRYGGGAYETTLYNCTVFGNSAGLGAGGTYESAATNSVIWANVVGRQVRNYTRGALGYCVAYPLPEGEGNRCDDPRLFSIEGLDGRICEGTPCLNTGFNAAVHESYDVSGASRIQQGTVDIGAYEGVVDDTGNRIWDAEKKLSVRPGAKSSFAFEDGSRAFVFGIEPLTANDFALIDDNGTREYVNSQIIDAEKVPNFSADDLWCQKMTEVNLCVWSGWSQYVGFNNEDDFAEFLRANPDFTESTNVLKWVMGHTGCAYRDYVSWSWSSDMTSLVSNLVSCTSDGERLVYLQMDWVDPGTTNIIGSHAVTCCGYWMKPGTDNVSPEDIAGFFIINSDNDKSIGMAGRYAPNSITCIPAQWDNAYQKTFLRFPNGGVGMVRFLCFLKARPFAEAEASVNVNGIAVPCSWIARSGMYDPMSSVSMQEVAAGYTQKRDGGGSPIALWQEYVAGTDPRDLNDRFVAKIEMTNGSAKITWMPDLGTARRYVVYGRTNLTDAIWHTPVNDGSRFFTVKVAMPDQIKANGYGFIDAETLANTNGYAMSKGSLSFYSNSIVDAEKIDGTDLDDHGCGEATGANMAIMTGWAQRAGFSNEDDLFKSYYQDNGTLDGGTQTVIQYVFDRLPLYSISDYYESTGFFDMTTFHIIESWIDEGCAVGVKYLHGKPTGNEGDHVVTVWGILKDFRFLREDPRHYTAIIVSDSDDDKHGYTMAESAPNRVKVWPVRWDEEDKVYYVDDGFLVDARCLAPLQKEPQ